MPDVILREQTDWIRPNRVVAGHETGFPHSSFRHGPPSWPPTSSTFVGSPSTNSTEPRFCARSSRRPSLSVVVFGLCRRSGNDGRTRKSEGLLVNSQTAGCPRGNRGWGLWSHVVSGRLAVPSDRGTRPGAAAIRRLCHARNEKTSNLNPDIPGRLESFGSDSHCPFAKRF
jgi:hypothetical protein